MVYFFGACVAIVSIWLLAAMALRFFISRPPVWYVDLPPKNWDGIDDDE